MNEARAAQNNQRVLHLILPILLLTVLSGCHFPNNSHLTSHQPGSSPEDYLTPSSSVHFSLELTQPLENGEQIHLEILDEVTGLPYHVDTHPLEKQEDRLYTIKRTFPAGSVVKYRYIKLGDRSIPEAHANGDPIRYRLCHVPKDMTVKDQLSSWAGETASQSQGTLAGTIKDRDTHAPLPDILISAGGKLTITDANGQFVLDGLSSGVHNLVALAINGSYQTFQQGAQISPGVTTSAMIDLQARPIVHVRINLTPPGEGEGAPIYLAGNLSQLGSTFSELAGGMSLYPKKMPALKPNEDGTQSIDLQLYAGTDLRYKFTLGDGFWNAERSSGGALITRQLIVPNQDISLNLQVDSWRASAVEPITFHITAPPAASSLDEVFIQFKHEEWTEPIPIWPLGGNRYLYILFSPLDEAQVLVYRFCRNSNCQRAKSAEPALAEVQVQTRTPPVDVAIDRWENWEPTSRDTQNPSPLPVPSSPAGYVKLIELTPEMDASWEVYAPIGIATIAESGADSVIFTPSWRLDVNNALLQPQFGGAPFQYQLTRLLNAARSLNLRPGLFPQIQTEDISLNRWQELGKTEADLTQWQASYQRFILNYAKTAEISKSEWLILGGKAHLPFYQTPYPQDGSLPKMPNQGLGYWQDLISELRTIYSGQILWAAHAHRTVDPIPAFVDRLDGIYLLVDSPLANTNQAAPEEIAQEFSVLVDNHIYEVYRRTGLPIYFALAYPSVDSSVQGCLLIAQDCANDGLFLPEEMQNFRIDQDEQAEIYAAILPVIASRDWIKGTAFRGYTPTVDIQDGSSSIAGKPAMDLVWGWFTKINHP